MLKKVFLGILLCIPASLTQFPPPPPPDFPSEPIYPPAPHNPKPPPRPPPRPPRFPPKPPMTPPVTSSVEFFGYCHWTLMTSSDTSSDKKNRSLEVLSREVSLLLEM